MRPIKFRIYDPEQKRMIDSGGTPSMLISFFKQTAVPNTLRRIEYQQFTGILDKNGKEIYEGDIVQDQKQNTYAVEYSKKYMAFMLSDGNKKTEGKIDRELELVGGMKHVMVVGNIWENPELLEGK